MQASVLNMPFLQVVETILANAQLTTPTNPFVERFKYNVISSTLLSPNLPNLHAHTQLHNSSTCPQIPGKFSHSRTPSEVNQAPQSSALPAPH
ncbi:hypothetical protein AGABI2DRAFT_193080, partial [Agaricus bisporus var. bisporus H97]|uniref:hypothetical protein n=1 Tax=Agaricus bisporus var. bisporus (strain H97 / ATCC MYA-4626 / FGSC 10389) TaxID=936046 RepID=UPI00029F5621